MNSVDLRLTLRCLTAFLGVALACEATVAAQQASSPGYLTTRVGATDPLAISTNESLWAMFQFIATTETATPGGGARILQDSGLSKADAAALIQHIQTSIADLDLYAHSLSANFCSNASAIHNAPTPRGRQDLLAKGLEGIDLEMDARRAARLAEIDGLLSPGAKSTLLAWTRKSITPHLQITTVDHARRLTEQGVDAAAETTRFCSASATAGPQTPTTIASPDGPTLIAR